MAQAAERRRLPTWLTKVSKGKDTKDGSKDDEVEVVPDGVPGASKANFSRIYAREEWDGEALSGLGSREETTREFRSFLEAFLQKYHITSIVDAGCGHWPSGYQRFMHWQNVKYTGVDVVPYVVEENSRFFMEDSELLELYGLSNVEFQCGDVSDDLPAADLLIVKDVLMHLPNRAVHSFLENSVECQIPKYRAVMLVQNAVPPVAIRDMVDIQPGQLLPFDITLSPFKAGGYVYFLSLFTSSTSSSRSTVAPFKAAFKTVLQWQSDEPKVVQLWEPRDRLGTPKMEPS